MPAVMRMITEDAVPETGRNEPRPMPPRVVTFLFTDIQGSTRLWEAAPGRHAARPGTP